jgi:hypothetical protein
METLYSLRAIPTLVSAFVFLYLAFSYNQANFLRVKRSKIISSMVIFFIFCGIFFVYMSVVPIVRVFSLESYLFLTKYAFIFTTPVAVTGCLFWKSVFDEDKKNDRIK